MPNAYITYLGPDNWWQAEIYGYLFEGEYKHVYFWKKYEELITPDFVRDFVSNI